MCRMATTNKQTPSSCWIYSCLSSSPCIQTALGPIRAMINVTFWECNISVNRTVHHITSKKKKNRVVMEFNNNLDIEKKVDVFFRKTYEHLMYRQLFMRRDHLCCFGLWQLCRRHKKTTTTKKNYAVMGQSVPNVSIYIDIHLAKPDLLRLQWSVA